MRNEGVEIYADLTTMAVIGFLEVVKHYHHFKKIFDQTLQEIRRRQPAAVVLIDYPGFNLRLAKKIKQDKNISTKIIYYISPQVWAWKKKRVYFIKKYVDQMLVIFPFEQDFYAQFGVPAHFTGHPLVDEIHINQDKTTYLSNLHLYDYKMTLGLLPGSRPKEVERILPVMLEAAALLRREFPMIQLILLKAPSIDMALINKIRAQHTTLLQLHVEENNYYDALNACDFCLVTSGTATLETALLGKPMVVIYKTSWLTWWLARCFVRIPHIALVNIVAGKKVVPELLQKQATPTRVSQAIKDIFTNEIRVAEIKTGLLEVKRRLQTEGAGRKAAEKILEAIS